MSKKVLCWLVASLIGFVFLSTGCSKGDKCEKAIDKAMALAEEMVSTLGAMAGDNPEAKKEIEAKMKEARAEMAKKKPEMIKACQEEVKKNKDVEKVLDCIIDASGLEDLQKCEQLAKVDFLKMQ